jgi:predicted nucleotidyltransferase
MKRCLPPDENGDDESISSGSSESVQIPESADGGEVRQGVAGTSEKIADALNQHEDAINTVQDGRTVRHASLEDSQKWLIKLLENTIDATKENRSGCDDDDVDKAKIAETRKELSDTFSKFSSIIPAFVQEYRNALAVNGLDPGRITVYMVGGRVEGTPCAAGSDIDLMFAFEKPLAPHLTRKIRLKMVFENFPQICSKLNIRIINGHAGRFQILGGGDKTPQEIEESAAEDQRNLFLYQD